MSEAIRLHPHLKLAFNSALGHRGDEVKRTFDCPNSPKPFNSRTRHLQRTFEYLPNLREMITWTVARTRLSKPVKPAVDVLP